jgi:predicted metal-binding protein
VSQLEGAGQQVEALRRDNAMLSQRVMEMEAAVSVCGVVCGHCSGRLVLSSKHTVVTVWVDVVGQCA